MRRPIDPEPRRCVVCDQREKSGMDFHAHEDACVRAEQAKQAAERDASEKMNSTKEAAR